MNRRTWSTYWTAGYTVAGASDVIVNRYCRTAEQAEREAHEASVDDKARLIELGIAGEVILWIEKWRSREVVETEERLVVDTFRSGRRTEQVER